MKSRFIPSGYRYFLLVFIIGLLLVSKPGNAQLLTDSLSVSLVKEGITSIYNLQFEQAQSIGMRLKKMYPGHPANYLFGAMITYWKNYPLTPLSGSTVSFESDLRKCIEECNEDDDPGNAEILLTNLCARGLLLLYYSDNGLSMSVMPLAASTYKYVRRSFNYTDAYPDFYFFTGLYNYYREAYPDAYPVYKTFAFVFPRGNRPLGLTELGKASAGSIFLKAEATTFLTSIYQLFEKDPERSVIYSKGLSEAYPQNFHFKTEYIKSLLFAGRYNDAEKLINQGNLDVSNSFYNAIILIYKGILEEKKYSDFNMAEEYYLKGVKELSVFGEPGNEHVSFGYLGLSRISLKNNEEKEYKMYRKKAYELSSLTSEDINE